MKKNAPLPETIKLDEIGGAERFEAALRDDDFIETLTRLKPNSNEVEFKEFRCGKFLRNSQASLNRQDHDIGGAPVVSMYFGKTPKAVASPAAIPRVQQIVKDLQAPGFDVE